VFLASAMVAHLDVVSRVQASADLDRHLTASQRLASLLPLDDLEGWMASFKASWHLAAGTAMLRLGRPDGALEHFESAERLRPDDPAILLALGTAQELAGWLLLQAEADRRNTRSALSGERAPSPAEERLERAAQSYRAALHALPDLYEARLRLARTLYLAARVEAAAAEVRLLDPHPPDDYLRYLTLLVGGSISEARGRTDDAIDDYWDAGALCRGCHSATVALSHALLRKGDRAAARDLIDRLVNVPLWPKPADPWLEYRMGQWWRFDALLARLQVEVPQ
jgi:tetratricopeptide (TPR) repeat protein